MQECNRCLFTEDIAKIHPDGECEYCKLHNKLENDSKGVVLYELFEKIKRKGRKKKYDCLIGISGGLDSSTLLYTAVRYYGMRPLIIHFDNHFNTPEARHNMKRLIEVLNVNSITYTVDKNEYDTLNQAFLYFGLPDADIPNDIAMTKLMYDTAEKYGIKYILNGHDFRTEGSTPAAWTYMDAKYIESVYSWYTLGDKLKNFPLFTFWDQIRCALKGIHQVRPFYYMKFHRALHEKEMKKLIGWRDYGPKHAENTYTAYIGYNYLPAVHSINKSIVYLSARVRSGILTKEQAREKLQEKYFAPDPLARDLNFSHIKKCDRKDFDRYNFKAWRPVIWVMAKMGVVPWTFYYKIGKS